MEKNKFLALLTTGKNKLQGFIDDFYKALDFRKWEFIFLIIIGCFSFLLWEHLQLKKEFAETKEIASTLQKKTGLKLYSRESLKVRQVGEVYVQIPEEWTNVIMDQITTGGVRKHFIASFGDGFDFPYSNEYAFAVGVERRGVKTNLENFLENNPVSGDLDQLNTSYTKVNDEMFYIQRDDIGREYFRKVDDVILVVFVYNNGDREIDDFEQRFINSVGPVETDTLFDYK
jgi:hypothetical protein